MPAPLSFDDQFEVVGLAADHGAERDQRVELLAFGQLLQRERNFQRARHGDVQHVFVGHAEAFEFFDAESAQAVADAVR